MMNASQPTLFSRHDTFFGVCEGIGQDLGFNPNYLRAVFAVSLLFAPKIVLAAYLGLGLVVLATRKLFPVKRAEVAPQLAVSQAPHGDNDAEPMAAAA